MTVVGSPTGIRTRISTVRGWRLDRSPMGPLVDHAGIEPAVSRLQGGCLTVEANGPGMAGLTGFEPALSSETVRRGLRLPYRPRDGRARGAGPAGTANFQLP